jgi:hypothetical protein
MLNYRPLISPDELAKFAQLYFRLSGNQVSPEYLSQTSAKAIVFYKKRRPDDWLGGFVINEGYEGGVMRYLELFKNNGIEHSLAVAQISLLDVVEIGCIFLLKEVSNINKTFVLFMSLLTAYRSDRKIIIGGSFLPKFCKKLSVILNRVLFDRWIKQDDKSKRMIVYYIYKKELIPTFLKGLLSIRMFL